MSKKKANKKVAKKKVVKKEDKSYKFIDKSGDDLFLKPSVYNKIITNHSNDIILKKDIENLNLRKTVLEHERKNLIEQYNKALEENKKAIEEKNEKLKVKKEQHKDLLKSVQEELDGKAFSIVDEDTYKIMLED